MKLHKLRITIEVSYDTPFTNVKRKSLSGENLTTYFLKSNQDSFETIWN